MEKLTKRIPSGALVLLAVILPAFRLPSLGVCILLITISSLALLEFYRLLELTGGKAFKWVGVLFGAMIIAATWASRALETGTRWELEPVLLAALAITVFLRLFPQKNNDQPLVTAACTVFGVLYASVLFNYFTKLVFAWEPGGIANFVGVTGRRFFFYQLAVVKFSDEIGRAHV